LYYQNKETKGKYMKTINKVILSVGTVALLTSGAFAYGGGKCDRDGYEGKSCHKMMKGKQGKKNHIMRAIMKLDLTPEQRSEIKEIMKDARSAKLNGMEKPSAAFSETTFDKKKFVEIAKAKHMAKIEKKAETISQVYGKLNDIQKKNLKLMIDKFEAKKAQKMEGKNCQR
jgi:Spy/CpxP family protein refolding chaperone